MEKTKEIQTVKNLLPKGGVKSAPSDVVDHFKMIVNKGYESIELRATNDKLAIKEQYEGKIDEAYLLEAISKRDIETIRQYDERDVMKAKGGVNLKTWANVLGDINILSCLCELIDISQADLNIKHKMDDGQIKNMAIDFKNSHGMLSLREIRYILQEGVSGSFGKIFERLDIEVLNGWVTGYQERLSQAMEYKYIGEKNETGGGIRGESEKEFKSQNALATKWFKPE